jgi:hypothetical protein
MAWRVYLQATLVLGLAAIGRGGEDRNRQPVTKAMTADKAKEWTYPKIETSGGASGGPIATLTITTEDTFGQVWDFYAKKCGFDKKFEEKHLYKWADKTRDGSYLINDYPSGEGAQHSHTIFVYEVPNLTVTAVVFRPDDGKRTRIYLSVVTR